MAIKGVYTLLVKVLMNFGFKLKNIIAKDKTVAFKREWDRSRRQLLKPNQWIQPFCDTQLYIIGHSIRPCNIQESGPLILFTIIAILYTFINFCDFILNFLTLGFVISFTKSLFIVSAFFFKFFFGFGDFCKNLGFFTKFALIFTHLGRFFGLSLTDLTSCTKHSKPCG